MRAFAAPPAILSPVPLSGFASFQFGPQETTPVPKPEKLAILETFRGRAPLDATGQRAVVTGFPRFVLSKAYAK